MDKTSKLTKENCIAYREYELECDSSEKVYFLIGKPKKESDGSWVAEYRIFGKDIDITHKLCGVDGIQLLQLIPPLVEDVIKGNNINILWDGEKNLGLKFN